MSNFINIVIVLSFKDNDTDCVFNKRSRKNLLKEFLLLYHSIKKNFKHQHRINVIHCTDYTDAEQNTLNNLDVDIHRVAYSFPNDDTLKYACWDKIFSCPFKVAGTHLLHIDCDTIIFNNPEFNFDCDFQAMYDINQNCYNQKWINYLINRYNFKNIKLTNVQKKN